MSEKPHTFVPDGPAPASAAPDRTFLYVAGLFVAFWGVLLLVVAVALLHGESWLGGIAARDTDPAARDRQGQMWAIRRIVDPQSAPARAQADPVAQKIAQETAPDQAAAGARP